MSKISRNEMLNSYIKANVAPILVEGVSKDIFKTATVIPSDCSREILNGSYENDEFYAPLWYKEIIEKKNMNFSYLVIDEITKISKEEQLKFIELLKYRKISTFELPKNCVIIITGTKVNKELITEEIYSLVAHI